jgi:predicted P-loop ATPase
VRNYIECIYGISAQQKIEDAMTLEIEKHSWHPIREYLRALKWDGVSRLETLLVDYFGAVDSLYTRQVMRKWLAGAVNRVMRPGCKFDLVLVLVDPAQGSSKSTFFNILGREWFSDTFMTVHGKEALEQIQGAWIIEMAELAGLRKADIEAVKHFITKQRDQFRPAYARTAETYERQCVFAGTTNNTDFLRDPSGNRRFLPVDVNRDMVTKSVFEDLAEEVDQIWAEAMEIVKQGEALYLSAEVEEMARQEQAAHSETDERTGLIQKYLDTLLPANWEGLDFYERKAFIEQEGTGSIKRIHVCVAEVWCECLGKPKEEMTRYNTREINDIMKALPDWKARLSTKDFKLYGKQRYFERVKQVTN